jgi:hypothetical protein
MAGYIIRRETPERECELEEGRVIRLAAGWTYLEWVPFYKEFAWLASTERHATVLSKDEAEAVAKRERQSQPDGTVIRVLQDLRGRDPDVVRTSEETAVNRQDEVVRRVRHIPRRRKLSNVSR